MLHAQTSDEIVVEKRYNYDEGVKWLRITDVINDLNYIIISLDQRNDYDIRYKEALEDYRNRLEALR